MDIDCSKHWPGFLVNLVIASAAKQSAFGATWIAARLRRSQ
jgi:hypothetical protein